MSKAQQNENKCVKSIRDEVSLNLSFISVMSDEFLATKA